MDALYYELYLALNENLDELMRLPKNLISTTTHNHDIRAIKALLAHVQLENSNAKLPRIAFRTYSSISGDTAQNIEGMRELLTPFNTDAIEGEGQLFVYEIKRGRTFVERWLDQHGYALELSLTNFLKEPSSHASVAVYKKPNEPKYYVVTTNLSEWQYCKTIALLPIIFKEHLNLKEDSIMLNVFRILGSVEVTDNFNEKAKQITNMLCNELVYKTEWYQTREQRKLEKTFEGLVNYKKNEVLRKEKEAKNAYEESCLNTKRYFDKWLEMQKEVMFFDAQVEVKEICKYIQNNPYIVDFKIHDEFMLVAIEAPLEYIDEAGLKKICANPNSYVYPKLNGNNFPQHVLNHKEHFVRFLQEIFIGARYRIHTRAEFLVNTKESNIMRVRDVQGVSTSLTNKIKGILPNEWKVSERLKKEKCIIPHVHVEYYNCWSGNRLNAEKALKKNDLITCLETLVTTVKDINVFDSTVFSKFLYVSLTNPYRMARHTSSYDMLNDDPYVVETGDVYKTIYDRKTKTWRTFNDVFLNDFVGVELLQNDIAEELLQYID